MGCKGTNKTKLIILGVGHANQLVARECQPAVYRAFFDRVKPDVIGVERAPLEFARSHFYEFTHEQQHLILPYAEKNCIKLAPFDWSPSSNDQYLVWGTSDLEQPPFIREQGTYKDFLFFPQPFTYENDFFYSERKEGKEEIDRWIANEKAGEADFPRRLFLYRTFMQAMHIKQVAKEASGKVVLVVVGHMHKHDIENILKENEDIELVQSSSYGYPSDREINNNVEQMDRSFILAFNLLGVQASHGVDWDWMRVLIEEFQGNIAETILFQTRLDVLTNKITPEAAIHQYQTALDSVEDIKWFSFQRDVEGDRVDTYYDPFGGVSIKTRLFIELAREYYKLSHLQRVEELKEHILNLDEMNSLKKLQIQGYWEKHVLGES